MRSRTTTEIFNMSFLDVFACVLGAMILILIMVAITITMDLTAEAVSDRLEASKGTFDEDRERIEHLERIYVDGHQWENEGEELTRQMQGLESTYEDLNSRKSQIADQIEELTHLLAEAPSEESLEQELEVSKRLRDNLTNRMQINRDKTKSNIKFKANNPAAAIPQAPLCYSVTIQGAMDLKTGIVYVPYSAKWKLMLSEFRRIRQDEYPLFIVKQTGPEVFNKLRKELDDNNILYGFEPYTEFWDPVYVASGRDPMLD